ncbi:MAG TPA: hypothetical protein VL334_05160 [Anaerolineae bacterium]|nr:hypothetical protein [Anaerolineae bacterium]
MIDLFTVQSVWRDSRFSTGRSFAQRHLAQFQVKCAVESYLTRVCNEINSTALPVIGVTQKGLAALEDGDTQALPNIDWLIDFQALHVY